MTTESEYIRDSLARLQREMERARDSDREAVKRLSDLESALNLAREKFELRLGSIEARQGQLSVKADRSLEAIQEWQRRVTMTAVLIKWAGSLLAFVAGVWAYYPQFIAAFKAFRHGS